MKHVAGLRWPSDGLAGSQPDQLKSAQNPFKPSKLDMTRLGGQYK